MKVICKIRAFWDGEIIKPGQIVEIKGKEIPCWAKPLKKEEEKKEDKSNINPEPELPGDDKCKECYADNKTPSQEDCDKCNKNANDKEQVQKVNPMDAQELASKNESELDMILDELRTEALDKDITVDADDKTVIEQINELKIKLGKVNK